MAIQQRFGLSFVAISCLALTACDFNDDDEPAPMPPADVSYSYEVTVYNMTQGQPLSPVGVALHGDGMMWEVGTSASQALEVLAEGGDNSDFTGAEGVMASATGAGPIAPGSSETITVTVINEPDTFISVATMLVNTNDAFTGLNDISYAFGLRLRASYTDFMVFSHRGGGAGFHKDAYDQSFWNICVHGYKKCKFVFAKSALNACFLPNMY